jgi:hypothetical protein
MKKLLLFLYKDLFQKEQQGRIKFHLENQEASRDHKILHEYEAPNYVIRNLVFDPRKE